MHSTIPTDSLRLAAVALFALGIAACGGGNDKKAPAASAAPEAKAPAAAATPQPPAQQPAAQTAAAPAPAPAPAPATGGHSAVPTVAEWNAVTGEITVRGSTALGCETKALREWTRISCRGDDPGRGTPLGVTVDNAMGAETFTFGAGGVASLVYRFEEGTKVEATFAWERSTSHFVSEWPRGAPKPTAYGSFE